MLLQLIFDFPNLHRSYVIEHRQSTERLCFRIDWYFLHFFQADPNSEAETEWSVQIQLRPSDEHVSCKLWLKIKQRHLNEIVGISALLRAAEYVLCVMIVVTFLTFWYVG